MAVLLDIIEEGKFTYYESSPESKKTPLVLLHGLLGALSNFETIVDGLGKDYNVVIPTLPIFEIPLRKLDVDGLVDHVDEFVEHKGYKSVIVLGNSLGGHICQIYALKRPDRVVGMVLTGSSGLFESAMGNTFPKRGSRQFVVDKTEMVFYDPKFATEELIDEVYDTINDLSKAIRIVKIAKSAIRHNLEKDLPNMTMPVLLVWGVDDSVTPAWVGDKFHELLPNSTLFKVEKCGHVPMMEHPEVFNGYLSDYLEKVI